MKQNKLIIFLGVMSVVVLSMLNFTMFSQEQMYNFEQYRLAKVDYDADQYQENNQVLTFDNSDIKFSSNQSAEFENGLIISDENAYHVVNGDKEPISISGELSLENIYANYLIYYYTFYLSPIMFLAYIGFAIAKSIFGIAVIYTVYRIILHRGMRDEVYIKNTKFKEHKLSITLALFFANIVYAYSSFFFGFKLPIISYALMIVCSYIIAIKSIKKIKR